MLNQSTRTTTSVTARHAFVGFTEEFDCEHLLQVMDHIIIDRMPSVCEYFHR